MKVAVQLLVGQKWRRIMKAIVHHNSRHADCTVSEDQTGLKPYEVRVRIGVRGADILRMKKGTEELVVHRDNVDIHTPNAGNDASAARR